MLKNRFYYLAAALLMSSTFVACGDDESNPDTDTGADTDIPDEPVRDTPEYSYLSGLSFPGTNEDTGEPECCIDLNGEEGIDNALVGILGLVGTFADDIDLDSLIQGVIDDGSLILIFEHEGLPVDLAGNANFTINVYVGASEDDAETRANGGGTFVLEQQVATISGAEYRGGTVNATADELILTLDLAGLGLGDDLPLDSIALPLTPAIIFANVEEDAEGGIATADAEAYLTGGVSGSVVTDLINDLAVDCGAAGTDLASGEPGLLSVVSDGVEAGGQAAVVCNYASADPSLEDQLANTDGLCGFVGTICSAGSAVGGFFDVDTDGDDVRDGLSLGLFIEFAGGVAFNAAE